MLEMSLNPPDEEVYFCPVCEAEIASGTELYFNDSGECVGCEECLTTKYVEDVYEEDEYAVRESLYDY